MIFNQENRAIVYARGKIYYHLVLFLSFFGAIQLQPWFNTLVAKYTTQQILLYIIPWIITYIAAIYILPEIGFMIVRSILED